jgi:hypothetical protein
MSILITGFPFQINTNSIGNNSSFTLDTINQMVYAQVDGDEGVSSSDADEGVSSSDADEGGSSSDADEGASSSDAHEGASSSDAHEGASSSDAHEGASSTNNGIIDLDAGGKENTETRTPDFLNSPDDDTTVEPPLSSNEPSGISNDIVVTIPPIGGDNPPIGGDNPPIGGDNPPIGGDNPPIGGDNPPIGGDKTHNSKHKNDIKEKINFEFEKITKIISKTKNKVIVKDDKNNEKEIIIVTNPACPTQSEHVELNGIINPKSIRLIANFYPCTIENGGITMNMPESPDLKMAVIYIDNNNDNHAGTLISPQKIQSIDKDNGLFSIELDKKMKGNDPITGEVTTLDKINGLALYNNGNKPLEFKAGSSVALTATFQK